ncbi:glucuronate isomerase [Oricola sp.]|uniref:glucuronate isomerase n=1 Tax=Oricola sp. TaxID=1979950 RepID=UPI003BA9ACB1
MSLLHPDRLFSPDPSARAIAREIHAGIRDLPIISPHGHCDPAWFAADAPFADPASLLVRPDHYVLRMLISQGVTYEALGIAPLDGGAAETDMRAVWRRFAQHYYLFRGTPTRLWLDFTFQDLFGFDEPLGPDTADTYFDRIAECLARPEYRPRALFDRFGIEMLATTEDALDPLDHHRAIRESGWNGNVITTYRPDAACDPDHDQFQANLDTLAEITGCDTGHWDGYLDAHRNRRADFRAAGAVATDHGVAMPQTADLAARECRALFNRVRAGSAQPGDAALFRAQMLTEMARMSAADGMTMQIHPGSQRNLNRSVFERFGRDKGFDIPRAVNFVDGLSPMLNAVGDAPGLRIVVFTLDETTLARELAPLAGAFPALLLGPAWWFYDAPDSIRRFREAVTETAGFYNTVGFNDDTRAFPSIPARHDMARRLDAAFLAERVADHRLRETEAHEIARALTVDLPRRTYRLAGSTA